MFLRNFQHKVAAPPSAVSLMRIFFARTPRDSRSLPRLLGMKGYRYPLDFIEEAVQPRKNPATGTTHRSRAQRRIVGMWVSERRGETLSLTRGVGGTLGENTMARDFKREYELQKKRGDTEGQLERQRARRMYDKNGVARAGKDIDHLKPVSKGGKSNPQNLRLRDRSANRKDNKKN